MIRPPILALLLLLAPAICVASGPLPLLEYRFDQGLDGTGLIRVPLEFGGEGQASLTEGLSGGGLALDASGCARLSQTVDRLNQLEAFTLSGWIYSEADFENNVTWIDRMDDRRNGFKLYTVGEEGVLRLDLRQEGTPVASHHDSEPGFLVTGHWTFFAVSFDGRRPTDNIRFYRASRATAISEPYDVQSTDHVGGVASSAARFTIGSTLPGRRSQRGVFDNVRLFDRVLTAEEVNTVRALDSGQRPGEHVRILCLGDSIVQGCCGGPYDARWGTGGFRYYLEQIFQRERFPHEFVGRHRAGSVPTGGTMGPMFGNAHEGVGGKSVAERLQMLREEQFVIRFRPDVVLLHLGTASMGWKQLDTFQLDLVKEENDFNDLLDELEAQGGERMRIVVAEISPASSLVPFIDRRILEFNEHIVRPLAQARIDAGKNYRLVSMYDPLDPAADLADISHPNDLGHEKMAHAWWEVLREDWAGAIAGEGLAEDSPAAEDAGRF